MFSILRLLLHYIVIICVAEQGKASTLSQKFIYEGKVSKLPILKCHGLLHITSHKNNVDHVFCGIECSRNMECDVYFYTQVGNGISNCTFAKRVSGWNPAFVVSGTNHMYSKDCVKFNGDWTKPKNCRFLRSIGVTCSGMYSIYPDGVTQKLVFCDMHTAGGGWTVIQKRTDSSVNFYESWAMYKSGFGNSKNYWIGNHYIKSILAGSSSELYIVLEDWSCEQWYARYGYFWMSDEADKYRLTIGGYIGDAGDGLRYSNGKRFSTKDSDNDNLGTTGSCVNQYHKSGWWFDACTNSNLNGVYYNGPKSTESSIFWITYDSMKSTKMMIR